MLAVLLAAAPAFGATNLIANGTFEGKNGAGTLSGWSATGGTLSLVAGNGGGHAAQVAVNPGVKKSFAANRPVKAGTVAGTAYTLDGQLQSCLTGQTVCLLLKELNPAPMPSCREAHPRPA